MAALRDVGFDIFSWIPGASIFRRNVPSNQPPPNQGVQPPNYNQGMYAQPPYNQQFLNNQPPYNQQFLNNQPPPPGTFNLQPPPPGTFNLQPPPPPQPGLFNMPNVGQPNVPTSGDANNSMDTGIDGAPLPRTLNNDNSSTENPINLLVDKCLIDYRKCLFPHGNDPFSNGKQMNMHPKLNICDTHLRTVFGIAFISLPSIIPDCNHPQKMDGPFGVASSINNKAGVVFETNDSILPGTSLRNYMFNAYFDRPDSFRKIFSKNFMNVFHYLMQDKTNQRMSSIDICDLKSMIQSTGCEIDKVELLATMLAVIRWGFDSTINPLTQLEMDAMENPHFVTMLSKKIKAIQLYMNKVIPGQTPLMVYTLACTSFPTVEAGTGRIANVAMTDRGLLALSPICHGELLAADNIENVTLEVYKKFKTVSGIYALTKEKFTQPSLEPIFSSIDQDYKSRKSQILMEQQSVQTAQDLALRCNIFGTSAINSNDLNQISFD